MNTTCKVCHCELKEQKGNFTHSMFGQKIEILNAPYLKCERCDFIEYIDPTVVASLVKQAYRYEQSMIDYTTKGA